MNAGETTSPDPRSGAPESTNGERASRGSTSAKLAVGLAMGSHFVASTVGGVLIGLWLDEQKGIAPWGVVGGSVLGLTAGLTGLVRIGRRLGAEATRDAE